MEIRGVALIRTLLQASLLVVAAAFALASPGLAAGKVVTNGPRTIAAPPWHSLVVRVCGTTQVVHTTLRLPGASDVEARVLVDGREPTVTTIDATTAEWAGRGVVARLHQLLGDAPLQLRVANVRVGCVHVRLLYRIAGS